MQPAPLPPGTDAGPRSRRRSGCGWAAGVALATWLCTDDASAAALGGVGTSVGLLAAIVTWVLFKGWQSHLVFGGIPMVLGLLAMAAGVALSWRSASAGSWRATLNLSRLVGRPAPEAGVAPPPSAPVSLPDHIDRDHLVADLRRHFVDLQAAWDLGAREAMGRLTTPDMLEELCAASAAGMAVPNRTEVVSIEVQLLLFEERDSAQVVCVEFSGMVRETVSAAPSPFREFWMLTRGRETSSRWRLARHQALL